MPTSARMNARRCTRSGYHEGCIGILKEEFGCINFRYHTVSCSLNHFRSALEVHSRFYVFGGQVTQN